MVALGGNAALVKWRLAFGDTRLNSLQSKLTLTHIRKMDRQDIRIQARKVAQDKRVAQRRISRPPKTRSNSLRAFFWLVSKRLKRKRPADFLFTPLQETMVF